MGGFAAAAEAGAHALETDLHLSRDGVIVLSHVSGTFLSLSLSPSTCGSL